MTAHQPDAPTREGVSEEPLLLLAIRRMAERDPGRHLRIIQGSGTTVASFVAEVDDWLAAHEAAAWDEGWRQGAGDAWQNGGHESKPNPYRGAR